MNISAKSEVRVIISDGMISIDIPGERVVRFPVSDNPRLAGSSLAKLNRFELSPFGIHWPDLDEDLSFAGLLAGDWGQPKRVACAS